jgi:hypothetical protein
MNRTASVLCFATTVLGFAICIPISAVAGEETQKVPLIDGAAGPCVLQLTVKGPDGKAVYDATVKVHIAYGFAGVRKLDLQAGTNSDGKVKFTGLPERVHRPPLEFDASKGDLEGSLTYDPSAECQATHEVTLAEPKAQPAQ